MTNASVQGITLHEKLQRLAVEAGENPLTMGDSLQRLAAGSSGYGIPLLLLSLPGALPMPALGLNSLLGVVVVLLGLQMVTEKNSVWLPQRFTRIRLRPDWSQRAARFGERVLPNLPVSVEVLRREKRPSMAVADTSNHSTGAIQAVGTGCFPSFDFSCTLIYCQSKVDSVTVDSLRF